MRSRTAIWLGLFTSAFGFVGCGGSDLDARLSTYRETVSRVLAAGTDAGLDPPARHPLPRRRDRRIDSPEHRINGFDFLAIQGCRLSELVGKRNGAMGRQMVPSQRLIYELQVLEAAGECVEGLGEERARKLGAMIELKRAELPHHVWNAVWLGEEIEAFLATSRVPFAAAPSRDGSASVYQAARVLERPIAVAKDAAELERALADLRASHPAGASLTMMDRIASELTAVASLLEPRAPSDCRGEEAKLAQLFENLYLPLQADLAAFDRHAYESVTSLDRLYVQSVAAGIEPSPAMAAYHERRLDPEAPTGAWQGYRIAIARHVRAWEPTLRICDVLPGGPSV